MNRASFLKKALVAGYGVTLLGRLSPIEAAAAEPLDEMVGMVGRPEVLPKGWLPCDGSAIRAEDYPDLYKVIGEMYGAGPEEGTFRLPDLRARVVGMQSVSLGPEPYSTSVAAPVYGVPHHSHDGSAHYHGLTTAQLPAHSHSHWPPPFVVEPPFAIRAE